MRHRHAPIASLVALSLLLSGLFQPALAGGLISTERAMTPAAVSPATPAPEASAVRLALLDALSRAGVDRGQAQDRVAALTDAEVLHLSARINEAPAGGLWFAPFLLVAMVIGALIGTRETKPGAHAATDLFGRSRDLTAANH